MAAGATEMVGYHGSISGESSVLSQAVFRSFVAVTYITRVAEGRLGG